jgi:hypothetical protein
LSIPLKTFSLASSPKLRFFTIASAILFNLIIFYRSIIT